MHPFIESTLERPTSQKLIILGVSVIVVAGLCWQMLISSKLKSRADETEAVLQLETNIATERRLVATLDKARIKMQELDALYQRVIRELPDQSEVSELLEKISNKTRETGLELNLFKRKDDIPREFFAEVPVAVSITGNFHQVATFFDEVARLSRIVNVTNISFVEPKVGEDSVVLKVDCLLTAFRYLTDAEMAQQATLNNSKNKRH